MEPGNPNQREPCLLVANGSLLDPNFKRSVVLVCEHGENGAYGLILNRPTDHRFCDMFPDTPAFQGEKSVLWSGGPCEPNRVQVLHGFSSTDIGGVKLMKGVYIGGDLDLIVGKRRDQPEVPCRFYMGYSGWGEGQLENELECKSWIKAEAGTKAVFCGNPDTLWSMVLNQMGGYYTFLSTMPPDIRMN